MGVYFADFGSFRFRGKKSRTVFESNKDGSHMVVFVTLFTTNFIEVQKCVKRSKFLLDFNWGSLFSLELR